MAIPTMAIRFGAKQSCVALIGGSFAR